MIKKLLIVGILFAAFICAPYLMTTIFNYNINLVLLLLGWFTDMISVPASFFSPTAAVGGVMVHGAIDVYHALVNNGLSLTGEAHVAPTWLKPHIQDKVNGFATGVNQGAALVGWLPRLYIEGPLVIFEVKLLTKLFRWVRVRLALYQNPK